MNLLVEHGAELAGLLALGILFAERVARLTPTESDNKIVKLVRKVAQALGLDFPDIK